MALIKKDVGLLREIKDRASLVRQVDLFFADMTHVHFIGIGGSGLSAIARLLRESGYTVTGSDRTLSPFAADLQAEGTTIYVGHHPRYVQGADWVVRSSAVPDDNPEVQRRAPGRHSGL